MRITFSHWNARLLVNYPIYLQFQDNLTSGIRVRLEQIELFTIEKGNRNKTFDIFMKDYS